MRSVILAPLSQCPRWTVPQYIFNNLFWHVSGEMLNCRSARATAMPLDSRPLSPNSMLRGQLLSFSSSRAIQTDFLTRISWSFPSKLFSERLPCILMRWKLDWPRYVGKPIIVWNISLMHHTCLGGGELTPQSPLCIMKRRVPYSRYFTTVTSKQNDYNQCWSEVRFSEAPAPIATEQLSKSLAPHENEKLRPEVSWIYTPAPTASLKLRMLVSWRWLMKL